MKAKTILFSCIFSLCIACLQSQPLPSHDLIFQGLPVRWDEALPLGNGTVGNLVWEKGDSLRFSLDRVDLWDERPMVGLDRPEFRYDWVREQVLKDEYELVQQYFDSPYDREPAPTKIPGAALMFPIPGKATSSRVNIGKALATVIYPDGIRVETFVHATLPVGWFKIRGVSAKMRPVLMPPPYTIGKADENPNSLDGDNLVRLGYVEGTITSGDNHIAYHQPGWNDFAYDVYVQWQQQGNTITGAWSISTNKLDASVTAREAVENALRRGYLKDLESHQNWWSDFWSRSSIRIPDSTLERQWYLEQYKFGSVARKGAPAISLQAVWTADNGRIPPWKGDFHHDLNTQLSYWPAYSSNHLREASGFLDFLEAGRPAFEKFTREFFQAEGLAVPGVTALDGSPMGGWTQYSCSPTTSAWLAQHYYLQWRYSMDRELLRDKVYPWFRDVAIFLEDITIKDAQGKRQLPLSSSPEINNNRIDAWFLELTNYDLALITYVFQHAAELAEELNKPREAARWRKIAAEFPEFALDQNNALKFAPNLAYKESHRHFSHLMAIHPLGLINWEDGPESREIIRSTIDLLESTGPDYWVGYSWAWLGNLKARAKDGEGAAEALKIFATAFCSPNSFHLNGDQTKSGYSKFTYRPFTLEGNFAFAAGIQEMLLQSYAGFIEVFPAVPASWQDISFSGLRAEGAYLLSAERRKDKADEISVKSEKGGTAEVKLPFEEYAITSSFKCRAEALPGSRVKLVMEPGGYITLKEN